MSIWNDVRQEFNESQQKSIRTGYYEEYTKLTGRNLLVYYSDFISGKPGNFTILDHSDKGLISDAIKSLDESAGVDVMIESPGGIGDVAEAIADLLHTSFPDVRFIVPNMAKSAATVLCLSGSEILMNEQSELGPIDPQIAFRQHNGQVKYSPSHLILQQFQTLLETLKNDESLINILAPQLELYFPARIQECFNAQRFIEKVAVKLLSKYMFNGEEGVDEKASNIAEYLSDFSNFLSHSRPINVDFAKDELGLKIRDLRENEDLNEIVNYIYISIKETFNRNPKFVKLVENNNGHGTIRHINTN